MKLKYLLAASVVTLGTAVAMPAPLAAQQITSGIEGTVSAADGAPLAGATVVVTDTRTGQSRTVTTGANGSFRASSLVPGGPYTVTATAAGYEGQSVEDQFITVSGNLAFNFELSAAATATASADTIIVTAQRAGVEQLAVGPGIAFGQTQLEAFPSISRDVRDIIRIDPRVSLDRDNAVDRISCLGGNDRTNTFTVDGIVQADTFGLNGTPFAARNALPLPFDVIRETSVEFAPFDVEYSDFTGCLVNVVTKSGENQFHGSAFFTFRNEDLRGDSIDGTDFTVAPFEEKRWGATLGGPIVPDRLFFYAGYEETDLGDIANSGPAGANFPNDLSFVTDAQFNRFADIANRVYGQDIGGAPRSLPESSVRYFGRLDFYPTDWLRVEATYQRLEEENVEADFGGQQFGGINSFEIEGTQSDYYSVRAYADFTDRLTAEVRLSRSEVSDVQGPVGFGEAQSDNPTVRLAVGIEPVAGLTTQNGILTTGPGIFRSANQLDQRVDQGRFQLNYDAGDHQFKLGAEINDLSVYNLFAINATGTIFFENLDDFENGLVAPGFFSSVFAGADDLVAGGPLGGATIAATPTGDINEAAALFGRQIYSVYAQDEWRATDQLDITAGLRVQWYDGSAPRYNQQFVNRYGFSNANPFSKIDPILLPRLAASYNLFNDGFVRDTVVKAGVGIFSGGDPVVYFSNAFSNNGFSTGEGNTFNSLCAGLLDANGQFSVLDAAGNFTGFPACATQAGSQQAAAGLADTQSTDPSFNVPTVLRINAGIDTNFGTETGFFSDWNLKLDYIYSKFNDPLNFVDLSQTFDIRRGIGGFTTDGRPIYAAIDPTVAGCDAELQGTGGTPPVWTGVSPACFATGRDDEIQLTNGPSYESHVVSAILSKQFNRGVFTDGGKVAFSLGYAFTDSNSFRAIQSSTATSSFDKSAAFDRQNPAIATSEFESRHNLTWAVNFTENFFGDFDTDLGFVLVGRSGRPYSLTFDGDSVFADRSSGSDNALLYVPTGAGDPNVSPLSDAAAVTSLINYVDASGCDYEPGQTIRRNTCRADWYWDLDFRFSQEIPGPGRLFGVEDRIQLFADFDNVLNLLDSGWNVFRNIPGQTFADGDGPLVDVTDVGVDTAGRYIISGFNPDDGENIGVSSSIWRIQLGVRYEF